MLTIASKKPWSIDPTYFSPGRRPLYLTNMAVAVRFQGRGFGREAILDACRVARDGAADVLRLDAYDTEPGAGGFYARCGFAECGRVVYRGTPLVYYELRLAPGDPGGDAPDPRAGRAEPRRRPR